MRLNLVLTLLCLLTVSLIIGLFEKKRAIFLHSPAIVAHTKSEGSLPKADAIASPSSQAEGPVSSTPAREKMALLVEDTLRRMPTVQDLRALAEEEVHFTPQIIVEAGKRLATIALLAQDEPDSAPGAVSFYETCASDRDFPVAVRAVCYSNLMSMDLSRSHSIADGVPKEVRELASQLD